MKLDWFGTYWVEVDTDNIEAIKAIQNKLTDFGKWRFIKFIVVTPQIQLKSGSVGKNKNGTNC